MSRREARRRPVPPPPGYHWETGKAFLIDVLATILLVEDGRRTDEKGYYVDVGTATMGPRWHTAVEKESQVRTATRRLLAQRERDIARTAARDRLRARVEG